MQRARPILWDIYEEHLDEAAFLWGQWEDALVGANYTLDEVAEGPEERLLAHLDGLVLGGKPVAERLLLPALADDDVGKVSAAAWALLQAEDADHFETVSAALLSAEPPAYAAIARALELSHRADLVSRMTKLWASGDARLRGVILDVTATRDAAWTRTQMAQSISAREAPLLAAALRAARYAPDPAYASYVEYALGAEDPTVRAEAIATGFIMEISAVREACYREAQTSGNGCRLPLALLALAPANRKFIFSRLALPEVRGHALWALGFAGDLAAAEAAIAALSDKDLAPIAGEVLSTIMGIQIAGPLAQFGKSVDLEKEEVRFDDPPPEIRTEDHLRVPNAETVTTWWRTARAKFDGNSSYLYGRSCGRETTRYALRAAAMWRRPALILQLAANDGQAVAVDVRRWARRQAVL
jgi:uncharacterized protein (TIGR02270 family)